MVTDIGAEVRKLANREPAQQIVTSEDKSKVRNIFNVNLQAIDMIMSIALLLAKEEDSTANEDTLASGEPIRSWKDIGKIEDGRIRSLTTPEPHSRKRLR
jgi:hypothetical protein